MLGADDGSGSCIVCSMNILFATDGIVSLGEVCAADGIIRTGLWSGLEVPGISLLSCDMQNPVSSTHTDKSRHEVQTVTVVLPALVQRCTPWTLFAFLVVAKRPCMSSRRTRVFSLAVAMAAPTAKQ